MSVWNLKAVHDGQYQSIVRDGLQLHLDAGDNKSWTGTGTWNDLTLNGLNATLVNNPTFVAAPGAFNLSAASLQYFTIPNSTLLDGQFFSIEVWIKTNNTNQNGFYFSKGEVNTQYALFQESTSLKSRINNGVTWVDTISVTTSSFMNTTSWYQVVHTHTSAIQRLYINSSLIATGTTVANVPTTTGGQSIGAYGGVAGAGGRGYYFDGSIAIVRIYNRVITSREVIKNYNFHKARFGLT